MSGTWDAIVVGARCAGAPTAMLLARAGHRVLLVDRAGFPSDPVSTGGFQLPGIRYLDRWGLLDEVIATGAPAITRVTATVGRRRTADVELPLPAWVYAPRRRVLDALLVEAAQRAGTEIRERCRVASIERDREGAVIGVRLTGADDGSPTNEHVEQARIVIGADGVRSTVARSLDVPTTDAFRVPGHGAYAHYSGVPSTDYEFFTRPFPPAWVMLNPTNGGLTCVTTATWRRHQSPLGRFEYTASQIPEVAARLREGERVERVFGYPMEPMFFRQPFGPGWALVGDAGFHQGATSGLGMSHAFRDADNLAAGVDQWLTGAATYDDALTAFAAERDRIARPIYNTITGLYRARYLGPLGFLRAARLEQEQQRLVTEWAASINGGRSLTDGQDPQAPTAHNDGFDEAAR